MQAIKQTKISRPVILTKILIDGRLLIVDSQTTAKYLDRQTLTTISGFKGAVKHERYKTAVVAFSNDGDYFASISQDCRDSKLYNLKTKKAIAKVSRHQGEISCVGIDPKNGYMFSCGEDGKTFAIDIKSGKLAFTLPPHADTINDIVFSDNAQWLATVGYDRKVSIFNLAMMTPRHSLKIHANPVMKAHFLNDAKLVSVDKGSKAIVWDVYTGKIVARLQGIHDDVFQITKSSDGKFLFLGTVLGYVLVYELETYTLLDRKFIKLNSSITSLGFDKENNQLIVGTENGEIEFYSIYKGEGYLEELFQKRKFKEIEDYVKQNPLLVYTKIYTRISNLWQDTVKKVKHCLQNGKKSLALELFKPYENVPSKAKVIKNTLNDFAEFEKFSLLVKENKIPLAYSIANSNPVYKESNLYKNLESKWKKSFLLAQKKLLSSKNEDEAREILSSYRGISEKTAFIQELFSKGAVYKRFKIYLAEKKFKLIFQLVNKYTFLKEFPEYDAIMNYGDTLYMGITKLIDEGDSHLALKKLNILKDFIDYEEEVNELIQEIEQKQKFSVAIQKKDLVSEYDLLAVSPQLQNTKDGIKLQEVWEKDLQKANNCAVKAEVNNIKIILDKYMLVSSKYMSLATVFAWCYRVELENLIKTKTKREIIEEGIKKYLLLFGASDQILSYFEIFKKYYPDTKLDIENLNKGSMSQWRPSMIVDSILS